MARELINVIEDKRKNYIMNAGFDFFQRHGPSHTFTSNTYVADRWFAGATGNPDYSRETSSAPAGTLNYLRVSFDSGEGINDFYVLEDFDVEPLKGKTVTFSVLLRRTGPLNDGFALRMFKNATPNTRTGGTWVQIGILELDDADIPVSTDSVSDWQEFKITVTIPDDGTANGLRLNLVNLSAFAGAASSIDIAQPMLNIGESRAPFSLYAKDYDKELAACQRYYEKTYNIDTAPGTVTTNSMKSYFTRNTGNFFSSADFEIRKRTNPSITFYSPVTGSSGVGRDGTSGVDRSMATFFNGEKSFGAQMSTAPANNEVDFHFTADAEFS